MKTYRDDFPSGAHSDPYRAYTPTAPAAFARTRLAFLPDPIQSAILDSPAKRGALLCTRQWGKSTVLAAKAVHRAFATPNSLILIASPGDRQSRLLLDKSAAFLTRLKISRRGVGGPDPSLIHEWHKSLLHAAIPPLIEVWERKLKVKVSAYFLQRMKTKWGSCNHEAGHIRLNTELVKKPKDLLECVVVHEMVHLIEPTHNDRFVGALSKHYPTWREARAELNELPLAAEVWRE